jgi:C1A family cysteine protease
LIRYKYKLAYLIAINKIKKQMLGKNLAAAAVFAYSVNAMKLVAEDDGLLQSFLGHCATFGVSISSAADQQVRFAAYQHQDAAIVANNAPGASSFVMGHNELSTLTDEEYTAMLGHEPIDVSDSDHEELAQTERWCESNHSDKSDTDGDSSAVGIDWRKKGAVNKVVSQGSCGSCYSFGAICSMESLAFNKSGKLDKYAEQVLVSCDKKGSSGCSGGLPIRAFTGYYA